MCARPPTRIHAHRHCRSGPETHRQWVGCRFGAPPTKPGLCKQAARVGADQTAAMLSDEGARLKAAARTADADATAARAEAAQVDGSALRVPLEYPKD